MSRGRISALQAFGQHERVASYAGMVALAMLMGSNWSSFASKTATTSETRSPIAFWSPLQIMGSEVEHYGTLAEMASASTAVVRGHFTDFALSRQIQGDAAEDVVSYGVATLTVKESIQGEQLVATIPVEFLLPDTAVPIDKVVASMKRSMPHGELLLFLRRKRGRNESQFFRVVNSKGLWMEGGSGVYTPLARPHQGVDWHDAYRDNNAGEHRYARELVGVRSLTDLAGRLLR